jgi:hypothetical protein
MNDKDLRETRLDGNMILQNVRKYSYVPNGVWILEMFMEYDNPEFLTKQSYEPLWTFVDAFDEPVKPNLKACILLVESSLRGAQEVMSEDEQKEKAEKAAYETLGGNAGIADKLNAREGISVPSNFKES